MRILVTGGAGFIGSHLVDALLAHGHDVAIIDDLSSGTRSNLNAQARFYICDVADTARTEHIFKVERPEAIFHLAAFVSVRKSEEQPSETARVNILGSLNIMRLAHTYGTKRLIVASTGGVMYSDDNLPTSETSPEQPRSPYAISKSSTDAFLEASHQTFGLSYVSLRCGNVYGPRQNPHGEAGVIAIFLEKMLSGKQPVIYGSGEHTRDYVYVDDVVEAYLAALTSDRSGIYNIGTGEETSVNQIFDMLNVHFDHRFEKQHISDAPQEQERSALDASKASRELGWIPKTKIEDGIAATVTWALKNMRPNNNTTSTMSFQTWLSTLFIGKTYRMSQTNKLLESAATQEYQHP
jgi:UDP-glucose 4-epimerase